MRETFACGPTNTGVGSGGYRVWDLPDHQKMRDTFVSRSLARSLARTHARARARSLSRRAVIDVRHLSMGVLGRNMQRRLAVGRVEGRDVSIEFEQLLDNLHIAPQASKVQRGPAAPGVLCAQKRASPPVRICVRACACAHVSERACVHMNNVWHARGLNRCSAAEASGGSAMAGARDAFAGAPCR